MKKILVFLFAMLISSAVSAGEATDFVKSFTNEALNTILSKPVSLEEKSKLFEKLFVKCTSMDMIASFALGRKIKSLTPEEKTAFNASFKKNMILMWTLRFTEYNGQHFEFVSEKKSENGKDVFVSSQVVSSDVNVNNPPIDVVWRIRTGKDGSLNVIDIIIADISMLKTYQTEYASFLSQNDGDINALIRMLDAKNDNYLKDIRLKDKADK